MTSESTYSPEIPFKPTWLMVKEHKITGLLYFCKTTEVDPDKYKGSGKYWKRHIKKHGRKSVHNLWCCLFTDKNELTKFATMCSEMWDIVESDEWANLKQENGLDGTAPGTTYSEDHCYNISIGTRKYKKTKEHCENISKGKSGKPQTPEHIKNAAKDRKGKSRKPFTPDWLSNMSKSQSKRVLITYPVPGTRIPDYDNIHQEQSDSVKKFCLDHPEFELHQGTMCRVPNGKAKCGHYKGFRVKYI